MGLISMNIKTRLTIIISIVTLLSVLMFVSSLNQVKNLNEMHNISKLTEEFVFFNQKIDTAEFVFLTQLDDDSRFFRSGKNNNTRNIKQLIEQQTDNVLYLSHNFYIDRDSALFNSFANTIILLEQINASYEQLFIVMQERGNIKYGKIGHSRILINDLKNLFKPISSVLLKQLAGVDELYARYLETKDPIFFTQLQVQIDDLIASATMSNISNKLLIVNKIQKLKQLTSEIKDLDRSLGLTNFDGLKGKINAIQDNWMFEANQISNLVEKQIRNKSIVAYFVIFVYFLLFIASVVLFYWQFYKYIYKPINNIKNFVDELVKGKLPNHLEMKGNDEIAEMGHLLNKFVHGLRSKAEFAMQIGQGHHNIKYEPLSDNDILGNALIEMDKSLQKADLEDQKYKDEEKKRIWANEGLALFSDLLRQNNSNMKLLSEEIIRNLVKYINATIGGLYYLNTDADSKESYLELYSAFAYEKKKYISSKVMLGEGLVGTCAIESEKMLLTDIPDNYVFVTSGLGDSKPNSILLVPLKLENEVLGVVELASFNEFKPHEVDFVEKITQSIASTITTVRINARTSVLLEQSQRQAQEMAEQEEEMRQNMEELRTTQEDFARREAELTGTLGAVNQSALTMVFDMSGKITEINHKLLNLLGIEAEDIVGRTHQEISTIQRRDELNRVWGDLTSGRPGSIIDRFKSTDNSDIWLHQSLTPVLDRKAMPYKVLSIATNITEIKQNEAKVLQKSKEVENALAQVDHINEVINGSFLRVDYSAEGKVLFVNEYYLEEIGYKKEELVGKELTFSLKDDEKEQMERIWIEVFKEKTYTGSIKRTRPTGEEVWLVVSFTPIKDQADKIVKVTMMGFNITERKLKYQLLEEANKEIERLKSKTE